MGDFVLNINKIYGICLSSSFDFKNLEQNFLKFIFLDCNIYEENPIMCQTLTGCRFIDEECVSVNGKVSHLSRLFPQRIIISMKKDSLAIFCRIPEI